MPNIRSVYKGLGACMCKVCLLLLSKCSMKQGVGTPTDDHSPNGRGMSQPPQSLVLLNIPYRSTPPPVHTSHNTVRRLIVIIFIFNKKPGVSDGGVVNYGSMVMYLANNQFLCLTWYILMLLVSLCLRGFTHALLLCTP